MAVGAGVCSRRGTSGGGAWLLFRGDAQIARVATGSTVAVVAVRGGRVAVAHGMRVDVYAVDGAEAAREARGRHGAPPRAAGANGAPRAATGGVVLCASHMCAARALAWDDALTAGTGAGAVVLVDENEALCVRPCAVSALAADTGCIAVGFADGTVCWIAQHPHRLRGPCGESVLAVALEHGMLAATCRRAVDVWFGFAHMARVPTAARPSALCFADGLLWVGVGSRGRLELWDGARCVGALEGHGGAVTGVALDAAGRVVSTSVTRDGRALWRSRAPGRLV